MKLKRILCALLGVCMITMPISMSVFSAGAESISSLQQKLEELEKQNKDYQSILDKAESDIKDKEEYKEALVNKIKNLNEKIAVTRESIEALNSDIEAKQKDIDSANSDIESQVDALCARLRTIYMAGSASDLEIILGAKDFSDFVDKTELVKTLSNYDKKLISEITDKLDSVSEQKETLENDKADLESKQDSLQTDLDDLNNTLEENEEILKDLYTESDNAKSAIESSVGESDEIQAKIASYYANQAAAAQGAAQTTQDADITPSSSGFTWPCPGFYYLSSLWNEDRTTYNHGAIDIAGSGIMGASVVAADSGTVIDTYNSCYHNWGKNGSCGCNGGYGNYVMIDHGNGKVTVYGHFTNVIVSTGQTVKKGQTIGYVGSTGNSTGPHLHFECRYNGVKYNPMTEYE